MPNSALNRSRSTASSSVVLTGSGSIACCAAIARGLRLNISLLTAHLALTIRNKLYRDALTPVNKQSVRGFRLARLTPVNKQSLRGFRLARSKKTAVPGRPFASQTGGSFEGAHRPFSHGRPARTLLFSVGVGAENTLRWRLPLSPRGGGHGHDSQTQGYIAIYSKYVFSKRVRWAAVGLVLP
jgi:hypothetical protein